MGANKRSAKEYENALKNGGHGKFLTEHWPFEDHAILNSRARLNPDPGRCDSFYSARSSKIKIQTSSYNP